MTIQEIEQEITQDKRNASYTEKGIQPIFQLSEKSKILLIGQAPGKKAEEAGILFQDKSGDTLRTWLGVSKEQFYSKELFAILPMDFYYPGKGKTGDLPPREFFATTYHKVLLDKLENVSLTILIGKYSIQYYLKDRTKRNMTETIKAYQEYLPEYFPIVHPSPLNFRWQAKNPWFLQEVVPDLQRRIKEIIR